jgi:hypothetical protein
MSKSSEAADAEEASSSSKDETRGLKIWQGSTKQLFSM